MRGNGRRFLINRGTAIVLAAVTVAMMFPASVSASVLVEDEQAQPGLRDADGHLAVPVNPDALTAVGKSLWVWSQGRRGYQMFDQTGSNSGFKTLVSYDLDTLDEQARTTMFPRAYRGPSATGMPHTAVVNQEGGELIVATHVDRYADWAATNVQNRPNVDLRGGPTEGRVCAGVLFGCFGGLTIYDGETLEAKAQIPYTPVSVEGGAVVAQLRALRFVPPADGFEAAKVLAVIEEWATAPAGPAQPNQPRYQGTNLTYAVQFDLASARVDWITRADACRAAREPARDGEAADAAARGYASGVFRKVVGGQPAVFLACHSSSAQTGSIVKIPLNADGYPEMLPVEPGESGSPSAPDMDSPAVPGGADGVVVQHAAQQLYVGPDRVWEVFADPDAGRILLKVVDGAPVAEVWWVFDVTRGQFVGTIGIGPFGQAEGNAVLDERTGRLYVVAPKNDRNPGGVFIADTRRTPLAQALVFPELQRTGGGPPAIDNPGGGAPVRLFTRVANDLYRIIQDSLPVSLDVALPGYEGRTLDLEEAEGVTATAFDGAGRGYGLRALLVGGVDSVARVGPADPIGQVYGVQDTAMRTGVVKDALGLAGFPHTSPCTSASREIVLGAVGSDAPAVVDGAGGRAGAQPIVVDTSLRTDAQKPISRCSPTDWQDLWANALFARPPEAEPEVEWPFGAGEAACVSSAEAPSQRFQDPTVGWFSASVDCQDEDISGWSRARAIHLSALDLTVAEASTTFRVYREPGRGVVSRVESVARGISLPGVLRIDSVRVIAESWANGRRQPVAEADRHEGYRPNCDVERSAGTCYRRTITGVWTPGWSCGPCGDEATMIDRLNRAVGNNGKVTLREPDPALARGAENGYIAAIQKPDTERFADLVLNNDLLATVVPGLEIVRYAVPNRTAGGGGPRGRQVYQFAGVEVSSSYGISCLLVYDEAANTCAEPAEAPGSIQVSLTDTEGEPLAGGGFEVRADVDADGVLGLKDTLLPDGACVTAEDGIGTCSFENLQPGTYLVSQVAAPPGYAKSAEPWVSEVASGEQRTVAFTNVSNVSTIDVTVTDEHGAPISGATFAAYPDPDSDGKVAPDAQPAAECTTDAQGVCTMKVPAGSYVLVQTSAPGGLEGIEPVPFTFASGGQVASVSVVNYPPAAPEQPAPAAAPVDYTPPVDYAPPVESVTDFTPVADAPVVEEPAVSVPDRIGGTVTQVIRAPGDALRLLARDPMQAAAWVGSLALFVLAAMAVRRRQTAAALSRPSDFAG